MNISLETKPCLGFSVLLFGASMVDVEKAFGKPEEIQMIENSEKTQTIVWHYWDEGFTLFFDVWNNQLFNFVEISNSEAQLWGKAVFDLKETQIIELFKNNDILQYES